MMMEIRPAPRKRTKAPTATAYHEAGHVVVGLHFHFRIKSVTIVPGEGFLGKVKHGKETHFYKSLESGLPSQRRGEESIIYRLAGLVAERRR